MAFTQREGLVIHPHTAAGQRLRGCGDGGAEQHARAGAAFAVSESRVAQLLSDLAARGYVQLAEKAQSVLMQC